jgi:hypothetical protein
MQPSPPSSEELELFAQRLEKVVAWLVPRLPEIDPDDLILIVQSILRPPGSGRRFILRRAGNGFVL